jgi:hypothetical protein
MQKSSINLRVGQNCFKDLLAESEELKYLLALNKIFLVLLSDKLDQDMEKYRTE